MRCPRCRRETADPAPMFCTHCGAPLRLSDEARPRSLESSVAIDRRVGQRAEADDTFAGFTPAGLVAAAAATASPGLDAGPGSAADVTSRSHWDLGAAIPRPVPGPRATPVPNRTLPTSPGAADADVDVDALEIHLRRPAPWRRALAAAVDVLPFAAGGIALARALVRAAGLPAPPTGVDGFLDLVARERVIVLSVAAAMALALGVYATLAHALAGATLGKRLLGIQLVGPDGARPSLGRSAARTALAALSVGLLGLGVLLAFFTRSGRALHDLLARTWVVEAP
jgi:resuscitation-promoting factor RpfA